MTITFATAVSSHECEDRIIAALTAQGFLLKFRAVTPSDLEDYLETLDESERTLLIFDETFGIAARKVKVIKDSQLAFLRIESSTPWSEEEIARSAHEALRQPSVVSSHSLPSKLRGDWYGVVGTSGSPGISTMAINIAAELSQKLPIRIVDADDRNQDLHILLGARREGRSTLTSTLSLMTLASDIDRQYLEEDESKIALIDIGESPRFHSDLFTDRRVNMRNTLNLITQSHHLIYVMQPENRALIELDLFLKFAEQELAANQITFLLNKMGNSTRHKGILRSLKNRIADQALFIVPRDYALFDRAQARYATLAEVGARTSARRAISDLSIYLSKSM